MVLLIIDNNDLTITQDFATSGTSLYATHAAEQTVHDSGTFLTKEMVTFLAMEAACVVPFALECMRRKACWDQRFTHRAFCCALQVTALADNTLGGWELEIL